ncbi:glycine-rich domain-containing protein [uncultured Fibrella sp.]|uniref:glycine-rich domain-containing protein n=1 Tax=uncultured Fibrella sp. TaxID=1284596 RepID=UPI0035CC27F5
MSGDEAALWTKLSTFAIDGADTRLTFAARLSRENGWTTAYTQRVMEEYRRFLFLCCVTPTGVTPSDPVDQAWHLHLTYTKSYWIDLCQHTLGRDIHHNPTKGGASEGQKFNGMYSHSQALYSHYFGTPPPADIWQDNQQRFSDIDFKRVNRRMNWIIRKPAWVRAKTIPLGLCLLVITGLFIQAVGSSLLALVIGGSVVALLIYSLASEFTSYRKGSDADGGDGVFIDSTDLGDGHSHGHGDGGHGDSGGDSGCSASGCGGGCGGGD